MHVLSLEMSSAGRLAHLTYEDKTLERCSDSALYEKSSNKLSTCINTYVHKIGPMSSNPGEQMFLLWATNCFEVYTCQPKAPLQFVRWRFVTT